MSDPTSTSVSEPIDAAETGWEAEKAIIATVAPTLARALGGPLGTLALTFVSVALALDPNTSTAQIAMALNPVTIDQLRALKAGETRFQAEMKTLKISARRLGTPLFADDEASHQHAWFPELFSLMITLLFFLLLTFFAWHPIPVGPNETVLNVMLGAVAVSFTTVVSYYFGSTRSSGRKDLLLYNSKPA